MTVLKDESMEEYSQADIVGVYGGIRPTPFGEERFYVVLVKGLNWDKEVLPIFIGEPEAIAIDMALRGYIPKRPLTHDLLVNVLETLGVKVEKVTIDALIDNIYLATIVLSEERNGKKIYHHVDARPSDSIAIALRTGAPIYVSNNLKKYAVDESKFFGESEP